MNETLVAEPTMELRPLTATELDVVEGGIVWLIPLAFVAGVAVGVEIGRSLD
jgi:hypothetical protein